ncbi:hypothetical protein I5693_33300 [Burkholderia cenocepacia]|uniref:hypothetical protein n=1 Tax=Burkholderia cepacia complex TaxID=87882 RepID=UPI00158C780B|nr:hypothetical protein [Burkholderia cenocepacia]MBJ9672442.1 hypothetical protein [Burkholderia cenocepacia]MBJ9733929.1 hypothetical protein [Burkholderia cenocepacia]MBR8311296.1 hypothetical protein [Burkholderia cenocepacia]MCA7968126.1 hypothetical protein [Burkholderia cenocepacia]MDR8045752.1 hypothetical protein [Burkholderia cenocepacia]
MLAAVERYVSGNDDSVERYRFLTYLPLLNWLARQWLWASTATRWIDGRLRDSIVVADQGLANAVVNLQMISQSKAASDLVGRAAIAKEARRRDHASPQEEGT